MLNCARKISPNPCVDCPELWNSGKFCDKGATCEIIKAYVEYRKRLAKVEQGTKIVGLLGLTER